MDKTAPVLQGQNATNCKLPTSKVQAKASATNDCKPGIPVADDNSASTHKDTDPTKQKSKLFGKRKSLGYVCPANRGKKEEKSRGSQEKKTKIDDKLEEKTSVSPNNLKQPTMLNFQRKVVRYKAVQIPKELGEVFLQFSRDNTLNNTGKCGVLGGKDAGTEFVETRLIIPKQQGTTDSCTALDEQSIIDTFETHNCIVLGWIHTHPSQTAFLSSVDLHNRLGYQCQLQEAVAIVCSIKYNNKDAFI